MYVGGMTHDWSHLKCPFCGFYPKILPDGRRELHYVILKLEAGGYQREPCPKSGELARITLKVDLRATEDEALGKFVYCTQHLRVHATGWCTVANRDKLPLDAETEEAALVEAAEKGYTRTCSFCGQSPAPYPVTRLTPEQQAANQAWQDSFKDGFHTGHCPHLELPTYACQACFEAHPESHLTP